MSDVLIIRCRAARIEDMRREIGVAQHTNGTTNGADELQLIELVDEGTYGKVFKGKWAPPARYAGKLVPFIALASLLSCLFALCR